MAKKRPAKTTEFQGLKLDYEFSEKQKSVVRRILHPDTKMVFLEGPAGTAKTYLGIYCALKSFFTGHCGHIYYIRTLNQSGEKDSGALPGNEAEKMGPFAAPLYDKLHEFLSGQDIRSFLMAEKAVSSHSINYCRGLNWKNGFIVMDEAQNFSYQELTTGITRVGEGSKIIVCGDRMQPDSKKSGFVDFMNRFDDEEARNHGVFVERFSEEDIVRSEFVKFVVKRINSGKEA